MIEIMMRFASSASLGWVRDTHCPVNEAWEEQCQLMPLLRGSCHRRRPNRWSPASRQDLPATGDSSLSSFLCITSMLLRSRTQYFTSTDCTYG